MSNRFAVYDSNSVDVIVAAIPVLDGRADDFFAFAPDEEAFLFEKGADGHVVRFATHNRIFKVELKLKRSSEEHQKLAALHALDTNVANGAGVGPFLCKDNQGATVLVGGQCWITKLPDWQFGKAVGDVTWPIIVVATPVGLLVGGN